MLTAKQCETVAYLVDSDFYCPDCVTPEQLNKPDCSEIIEYIAGEQEDGVYCGACGKEIAEPHSQYHTLSVDIECPHDIDREALTDLFDTWIGSLEGKWHYYRLKIT